MSTGKHIYDSSVCKSITNCISAVLASSFKQHKTNNLNDEKDLNLKKETATNGENDNIQQEKDLNKTSE